MQNKTVLITGATDGIGKQTALELARAGATVLLHGRDRVKGEAALAATIIYLASAAEVAGVSGKFFTNQRIAKASELADDGELRRRFWDVSARLAGMT